METRQNSKIGRMTGMEKKCRGDCLRVMMDGHRENGDIMESVAFTKEYLFKKNGKEDDILAGVMSGVNHLASSNIGRSNMNGIL